MKRMFHALLFNAVISPTLGLLMIVATGCTQLDKNADPLIVRAEQVEASALATFDLVLNVNDSNRDFFRSNAPEFHNFAEWLRTPTPGVYPDGKPTWPRSLAMIYDLHTVKLAYKTNRDAGKLNAGIHGVQAIIAQSTSWLSRITNAPSTLK